MVQYHAQLVNFVIRLHFGCFVSIGNSANRILQFFDHKFGHAFSKFPKFGMGLLVLAGNRRLGQAHTNEFSIDFRWGFRWAGLEDPALSPIPFFGKLIILFMATVA